MVIRSQRPDAQFRIAEIHTAAMQEGMRAKAHLKGKSHTEICARIRQIVRNTIPAIAEATGVTDAAFYERQISQAFAKGRCQGAAALSMWTSSASVGSNSASGVTGAFMDYSPALEAAILEAPTPEAAVATMDQTLASATSIPAPDYEVLADMVSAAASSVYYWYEVEMNSGGGGGPGDDDPQEPMSMFQNCRFWCRVGWADVIGMTSGAAAVVMTAGPGAVIVPQAVAAGAAIGMVANSLTAAM